MLKPQVNYRNLPQRLLKARECLMAHFRPILNHFGLTDQQWRILRVLDEYSALEPREICALCQIHSASMAGMLARMEELGMVERSRVPEDQRRVAVRLAPWGNQLVGEMAPLIDLQYQRLEEAYGQDLLNDLFRSLEVFIAAEDRAVVPVALPMEFAASAAKP